MITRRANAEQGKEGNWISVLECAACGGRADPSKTLKSAEQVAHEQHEISDHAHLDEFWRDSDPIHRLRENLKSCHQPSSQLSLGVGQHERVVEAKSDLAAVDPRSAH